MLIKLKSILISISSDSSLTKPVHISKRGKNSCKEAAGSVSIDKNVFGCYVHGFFDSAEVLNCTLQYLADKKGIYIELYSIIDKDQVYNKLSELIEINIDLSFININQPPPTNQKINY